MLMLLQTRKQIESGFKDIIENAIRDNVECKFCCILLKSSNLEEFIECTSDNSCLDMELLCRPIAHTKGDIPSEEGVLELILDLKQQGIPQPSVKSCQ
jgi:hypothetical protein